MAGEQGRHVQRSGSVDHDLRTLLDHIIGYSELMLEEVERTIVAVRNNLSGIGTAGRALLAYIDDLALATATQPEAGQTLPNGWRAETEAIEALCDELYQFAQKHYLPEEWNGDIHRIATANRQLIEVFRQGLGDEMLPDLAAHPGLGSSASAGIAVAGPDHIGELLVVDDNEINRVLLARRLGSEGYTVTMAENGRQALELIEEKRFELVLLDLMMPEISGIEALEAIRKRYSHAEMPVIMVTAKSGSADVVRALKCGANDYVTKPIDFPVVSARISTQLSLRRLTRELEIANEKLRGYSYLDGLTDIPNRRHFDEYLSREWVRAARTRQPVSLIIMDVDHFKLFNDTYGHEAGDRALKRVAKALVDGVRRGGDVVARYGGEEFVAVLPQTPIEAAVALAEKLRARVAALQIPHTHAPGAGYLTASFGVCSMVPELGRGSEMLLQEADRALYHAKKRARNCVSCAGGGVSTRSCRDGCQIAPEGCIGGPATSVS